MISNSLSAACIGGRPAVFAPIWLAAMMVAAVLMIAITYVALHTPPSFDGAMNLQVSWSLAQGEGYQRTYADREPFPREVQTNVPYVLPSALVYKVFGLGIAQSQVVNLLYLYALIIIGYLLLNRHFGPTAAVFGALFLLVTPGLFSFGLSGYGEVPALVWALAAVLAFRDGCRDRGAMIAGVCLGLALATKTVMAMTCGIFAVLFTVQILARSEGGWVLRFRRLVLLALASVAPLILVETWRLIALGGLDAYIAWWAVEFSAIGRQAGVVAGFADTADRWGKLARHLGLLQQMYHLGPVLLGLWLIGPILIATVLLIRARFARQYWTVLLLVAAATAYFLWWLLVTPTQKAWHRRILDGSLLLNLSWVFISAWWFRVTVRAGGQRQHPTQLLALLPALACLMFMAIFLTSDLKNRLLRKSDNSALDRMISEVQSLPRDSLVVGSGWYSAPVLSLLSGRPLGNFNDLVVPALDPHQAVYLAVDRYAHARHLTQILATYPAQPLLVDDSAGQIYLLDISQPNPDTLADAARSSFIDLTSQEVDYALAGFHQHEHGGRWMSSDAFAKLRYPGGSDFSMQSFVPDLERYVPTSALRLQVTANDCSLGDYAFSWAGAHHVRLAVPDDCAINDGDEVVLRLTANALVRGHIAADARARFVKVQSIGFVPSSEETRVDRGR